MPSSLDKLVENLKVSCKNINELRKSFKYTSKRYKDDTDFMMMISKGIYPYDYVDSYEKLNDTKLPSIEDFYSKLNENKRL